MKMRQVALGYWYQRTGLHLAEIQDFLLGETSPLDLSPAKLKELRQNLHIKSIKTDVDVLERLDVEFGQGIKSRIYEDGLVLLEKEADDVKADMRELSQFFDNSFLPAISYLFSLGAPVPKELSGVQSPTPLFVVIEDATKEQMDELFAKFESNPVETVDKNVRILKGGNFYLINVKAGFDKSEHLIESLIFFKEFKAQLHHYLNLHRVLWEKIEDIKEKGHIKGKEVGALRQQLESYKKTLELISGRINQMDLYIPTRSAVVQNNDWQKFLTGTLEFQYNNLDHTLDYIKSLWDMTMNYLDSAIEIFSEINTLSTRDSVNALTVISSIGVVSGVLGFLNTSELPSITHTGVVYFAILLIGTILINRILQFIYRHLRYKINDVKLAKISSDRRI